MIIFVHTITALKTHFEDAAENRGAIFKPENALYILTVPAIRQRIDEKGSNQGNVFTL